MKCANCNEDAAYIYTSQGTEDVPYCHVDLPGFLRTGTGRALLKTTAEYDEARAEALALLAPRVDPAPEPVEGPNPPLKKRAPAKKV